MRRTAILAVAALLLIVCSCSGGKGQGRTNLAVPAAELPAGADTLMPPFPEDSLVHMGKATAAINVQLAGSDFDSSSPGVSANLSAAQFISAPALMEWAIYRFSGSAGESIGSLSCQLSGLDAEEEVYLAISDYSAERWFFLPAQNLSSFSTDLDNSPGRFVSPLGNTYVAAIAFDGNSFDLQSLSLNYLDRFSINGQVVDNNGDPLPDVLVASLFGGISDTTDGNGNFVLSGLPEGNWPVAATADGWTFYDQPALVSIDGADGLVTIVGNRGGSNFIVKETLPGNNSRPGPLWDFGAGPLEECIAAVDDQVDFYSFVVAEPGNYYIMFEDLSGEIGINYMVLDTSEPFPDVRFGPEVLSGNYVIGFNVYGDPVTFSVEFRCFAGGGNYRISLVEGKTHGLGVRLENGGNKIEYALLKVEHPGFGESTYYGRGNNYHTFLDFSRLPGQTTLTPIAAEYNFDPQTRVLFMNSERLDIEFDAVPDEHLDNLEPNDSHETAQPLGALPYLADDKFYIGDGDTQDWYRFTPQAGQALTIRANVETEVIGLNGFGVVLYNAEGEFLKTFEGSENGAFIVPDYLTDGSEYFLNVSRGDRIKIPYRIEVIPYAAEPLSVGVRVAGQLEPTRAQFEVLNEQFGEKFTLFAGTDGLYPDVYFPAGAVLHIECMRYGLPVHRQTRRVVVSGAEQTILFDAADWGDDDLEPNAAVDPRPLLQQPFTINATAHSFYDDDFYQITNPGTETLSVTFNTPEMFGFVELTLSSPLRPEIFKQTVQNGQRVYFEPEGEESIDLRVAARTRELNYSISVESNEAYGISGSFDKSGGGSVDGGTIFIRETRKSYETDFFGNYATDLLPPGDYTMVFLAVGFEPAYEERTVTINNADLEENFINLVSVDGDSMEPNDSLATAFPIELGQGYAASCGALNGFDTVDWYRLDNLVAGTQVQFVLNAEDVSAMRGNIFLDSQDLNYGQMYKVADGLWMREAVIGTSGDYFIEIRGMGSYAIITTEIPD